MSFPRLPPSFRGEDGLAARAKVAVEHMAPGSMRGRALAAQPAKVRQSATVLPKPAPSGGGGGLVCYASFDCTDGSLPGSGNSLNFSSRGNEYGTGYPTLSGTDGFDINQSGFYLISLAMNLDSPGGGDVSITMNSTNSFYPGFGASDGNSGNWGNGPDDTRALGVFLRSGCFVFFQDNSGAHGIEQLIVGFACLSAVDDSFFGSSYTQI